MRRGGKLYNYTMMIVPPQCAVSPHPSALAVGSDADGWPGAGCYVLSR